MIAYLRLELRRTIRDFGYLIMTLAAPLALYLLFNSGGHHSRTDAVHSMIAMAGFGALGAVMSSSGAVSEDKRAGWLRQLRLTPLRPATVVVGRGVNIMTLALPAILAVCLVAGIVNGVGLGAANWAGMVALLWVGVAPIAMLCLGMGYLFDAAKAQAAGLVVYLVLSIVGGLFAPVDSLPTWLKPFSKLTPTYRYTELSQDLALGKGLSAASVGVLAAWAAAFALFAAFGYRKGGRAA
ncbi:ABC transporter permease [Actinoallomurus sp. CA-150999]|uniref:ABC transporter permease n=1 Tax=Actinoallomurus sp. CA-150999 TaxID=3239887 RepID=UPI003D911A08